MLRAHIILIWFGACFFSAHAQSIDYAKSVVEYLCSDELAGRGYLKNGSDKAASFIADEYKSANLKPFGNSYYQEFGFPVITFPNDLVFKVDQVPLEAGLDYITGAGCPKISGVFELVFVDSATLDNNMLYQKFLSAPFYKSLVALDGLKSKKLIHADRLSKLLSNAHKARGIIHFNENKLTWGVATEWDQFPTFYVLKDKIKLFNKYIQLDVQPELKSHQAKNIIGYIPGTKYIDSFIVITAHYDHLGMLGKQAIFPGANDNASGVAMMLDLMKHYSTNKPDYSIAFIAFAGEEAGLFGSYYYTQNALFPLKQISLLINLDMMGTGDNGMTVVNGDVFIDAYNELALLNLTEDYLPQIKSRGKASNSDHYYFSENGVRAFFFYLMGKYDYYHDVNDRYEALTFSKFSEARSLFISYINLMMK